MSAAWAGIAPPGNRVAALVQANVDPPVARADQAFFVQLSLSEPITRADAVLTASLGTVTLLSPGEDEADSLYFTYSVDPPAGGWPTAMGVATLELIFRATDRAGNPSEEFQFQTARYDSAPPTVSGDDALLGPNVQLLTATHPTEAGLRRAKWEGSAASDPLSWSPAGAWSCA